MSARRVTTFALGALVSGAGALGGLAFGADAAGAQARSATKASAWRPLIDAKLSAWTGFKSDTLPAGWTVNGQTLSKTRGTGDLVTRDQFGDMELAWDWKLTKGGNAGVFYRVTDQYDHPYWSGPEYQLLDDAGHADGRNRLTSAGAAYAVYPPPAGVVHAADVWNSSRVVIRGQHVEHWLNGRRVVAYDLGGPDWTAKVKASKFNEYPEYGKAARGRIGIQGDHDGELAIRNMRVRTPR